MHAEATSDPTRKRRFSSEGPFPVRLRLLGGFSVWVGSRAVSDGAWQLRKAKSLVKVLALARGHALHREQIMDLLWPELGKRAASNNLRGSLHGARRALAADSVVASHYLASKEDRIELCPEVELWVDVEAFEEAANAARRSRDPGAYRAALELYGGELLPEDRYEQWAEGRRGELLRVYLASQVELAGLYQEHGDYHSAAATLREVLAQEPTNEEAHVGLMRLYALSGQSGEALRQYERLSETLSGELGAEPSALAYALKEEIAAGSFPPPRTSPTGPPPEDHADVVTHNLPAPRTSFVGRKHEMLEIKRALSMTRLLTLIGVGGSGKTRLALEVARDLVDAYSDGVWLIELAPISVGALVPQAVARALSVREQPSRRSLADTLAEALRRKDILLVLDNCEHLVGSVARLLDTLLDSCPRLQVLATSREALNVEGETVRLVASLSVPDTDRLPAVEEMSRFDAVRLFLERTRLRLPTFDLTAENGPAVAEVCRKLEGIPLAIELTAARANTLSVEQISERLTNSLTLLTGGGRTAVARQRTLRGTLDWSHNLLSESERKVFRRLSVFAGGWTLEAAEAVAGGTGIEEDMVMDLLSGLASKSLAVTEVDEESGVRYRMLEPVRQYALEKLEGSGDAEVVRRRHAEFFFALVEEAEPELLIPTAKLLEHLETEHDNLRVVLSWAIERGEAELGQRLAGGLRWFWFARGHFGEGRRWLKELLQIDGPAGARVKALLAMSWLACNQDDMVEAEAAAEAGLNLSAETEVEDGIQAELLHVLASRADWQGDYEQAIRLFEEALALSRESGDQSRLAFNLEGLGLLWFSQGNYEQATEIFEECVTLLEKLGDLAHLAIDLSNLGSIALLEGNHERATALSEKAATLFREQGHKTGLSWPLRTLGWVALLRGDHNQARILHKESLILHSEAGSKWGTSENLQALACIAGAKGEARRAARLFGAAEILDEVSGAGQNIADDALHALQEPYIAVARSRLEVAAWEEAWAKGRAMTLEEAVEYALSKEEEETDPRTTPAPELPSAGQAPLALTRREKQVADLVARDLTNRQIAKELVISKYTVDNHLRNILKKLGLNSREQVGARMDEHR